MSYYRTVGIDYCPIDFSKMMMSTIDGRPQWTGTSKHMTFIDKTKLFMTNGELFGALNETSDYSFKLAAISEFRFFEEYKNLFNFVVKRLAMIWRLLLSTNNMDTREYRLLPFS